jgi:hypothetical protein
VIGHEYDDANTTTTDVGARNIGAVANPDAAPIPVPAAMTSTDALERIETRSAANPRPANVGAARSTSEPELARAHDAEAEAEATEVGAKLAETPARGTADDHARRGGSFVNAARMAASALGKAKELKHKLDDALAAHPIEHPAHAKERIESDEHALTKYNELAHGMNALEVVGGEHALVREEQVDTHVGSSEPAVRESHTVGEEKRVDTHVGSSEPVVRESHTVGEEKRVDTHVGSSEPVVRESHALREKKRVDTHVGSSEPVVRESDALREKKRVDTHVGSSEPVVRESHTLGEEKRVDTHVGSSGRPHSIAQRHAGENKRATIAEVEPVPTTNAELHRERALFASGAAWVVGGLAAVVLGILAITGVARPFLLVEVALLVAAASILVSSLANGARLLARREVRDDAATGTGAGAGAGARAGARAGAGADGRAAAGEDERDLDDAVAQPQGLHASASDRSVELHR